MIDWTREPKLTWMLDRIRDLDEAVAKLERAVFPAPDLAPDGTDMAAYTPKPRLTPWERARVAAEAARLHHEIAPLREPLEKSVDGAIGDAAPPEPRCPTCGCVRAEPREIAVDYDHTEINGPNERLCDNPFHAAPPRAEREPITWQELQRSNAELRAKLAEADARTSAVLDRAERAEANAGRLLGEKSDLERRAAAAESLLRSVSTVLGANCIDAAKGREAGGTTFWCRSETPLDLCWACEQSHEIDAFLGAAPSKPEPEGGT